jgi:nucleoside-diphosphate-sugar epimerase
VDELARDGVRTTTADLGDPESVRRLAEIWDSGPDFVVHCASSNRGGPDQYRRVFLRGLEHLAAVFPLSPVIFTSSTSVYSQTDGSEIDEESPAEPSTETGKILREAEDQVIGGGGIVLRVSGIYGPGRCHAVTRFLNGKAVIEGGGGHGRWLNQIHRHDLVEAIVHLMAMTPPVVGAIYHVADDHPLTQRAFYEWLAPRLQLDFPPLGLPDPGRKRGWTSKRISNEKLRATGWGPRYPDIRDALSGDPELMPSLGVDRAIIR